LKPHGRAVFNRKLLFLASNETCAFRKVAHTEAFPMVRQTGIGIQDFSKIIENNCFYVDKTAFIREWWESRDGLRPIGPIPVPTA
jgi:hypothetical protein